MARETVAALMNCGRAPTMLTIFISCSSKKSGLQQRKQRAFRAIGTACHPPERKYRHCINRSSRDHQNEQTQHVLDRKSTRLNSSHSQISYAVFCLKKKKKRESRAARPQGLRGNYRSTKPCTKTP